MPETQTEGEAVLDGEVEEETQIHQSENIFRRRSHESLWGALLFASMLLFVVASVVSIVWVVYSGWKSERTASAEPSITVLSTESHEEQKVAVNDETKTGENNQPKQEEKTNAENMLTAKKMIVTVLNGGATKGSAGMIATFLKTEGYTNVTAGNTLKDYTGTSIYYATGLDKESEIIKTSVVKKYPQAKILPIDVKNKETSTSQITIILGK